MGDLSMFLFSRPSLIGGICQIVDIGDTLNTYNASLSEQEADFIALSTDCRAIGADFQVAISAARRELGETRLVQEEVEKPEAK